MCFWEFCDELHLRQYFLTAVVNLELSCQALVRSSTVAGSNCCGAPLCEQSLNHTISSKERVRAEVGDRGKKLRSKPSCLDGRSEFSGCILSAGPHCLVLTVGVFGRCTGARLASCDREKEEKFLISI